MTDLRILLEWLMEVSKELPLQRQEQAAAILKSGEELSSWAMGGANILDVWVWLWSYHISIFSHHQSVSLRSKRWSASLLCRFPCPALHWTGYHGGLDCVESFKQLANLVGHITARVDLDNSYSTGCQGFMAVNKPCPRTSPSDSVRLLPLIPGTRAITITSCHCNINNISPHQSVHVTIVSQIQSALCIWIWIQQ